jgi:hypothetical protein
MDGCVIGLMMSVLSCDVVTPLPGMVEKLFVTGGMVIVRRGLSFSGRVALSAFLVIQMSRASHASSSLAANQISPSGPSPRHLTRYCCPLPRRRSSTILSTKLDFGGVEYGEEIGLFWQVERHCGVFLISRRDDIWAIKTGHELSYAWFFA